MEKPQKIMLPKPKIVNAEMPKHLVQQNIFDINDNHASKYIKQFEAATLGLDIMPPTGLVLEVKDGQAKNLEVQQGWFMEKVCDKPYEWIVLEAALVGACGQTFSIQFREPLETDNALPEDDEGMKMNTKQGTEGNVKVFVIETPRQNVAVGYIFNSFDFVSDQGVVQHKWGKLNTKYTRGMGVPLKVRDEIISVNNEPWDDVAVDDQFRKDAGSGKLGKLTFLYITG